MMQLGFTTLYGAINPPTPTMHVSARWQSNSGALACPLRRDMCLAAGDDFRIIVTVRDSDGNLQDLGGAQDIVFGIYLRQGGTEVVRLSLSGDDLFIGSPHQFFVNLRNVTTAALSQRSYWHETLIANNDGWRNTVLHGNLHIEKTSIGALT